MDLTMKSCTATYARSLQIESKKAGKTALTIPAFGSTLNSIPFIERVFAKEFAKKQSQIPCFSKPYRLFYISSLVLCDRYRYVEGKLSQNSISS